ncbi:GHMP Kinase, C-terminal domain-containing protein [Cylindrobasidium torrendii FP15055 ss-10]|uniref:GHMP Kinase, C-terminal domain-containing protein n=1 Tax=Cylindrobasidium torrendii FP15055 ss-10 TaxID=1314674 RepID=A0A0D7AT05_9AGAR|nr:GHMP Kinase, C-terminal domain-containing protein [Cylindrobasidium torrendii FP15055 ss-10]
MTPTQDEMQRRDVAPGTGNSPTAGGAALLIWVRDPACHRKQGSGPILLKLRPYLAIANVDYRRAYVRIMLGEHRMAVQMLRRPTSDGRLIPREWRRCRWCIENVEDETHVLLQCNGDPSVVEGRTEFWQEATKRRSKWHSVLKRATHDSEDALLGILLTDDLAGAFGKLAYVVLKALDTVPLWMAGNDAYIDASPPDNDVESDSEDDLPASVIWDASSALQPSPVSRPPGAIFVCANSLVVSDKAASAEFQYNPRVVETLALRLGVKRYKDYSLCYLRVPDSEGSGELLQVGPKEAITLREVLDRHVGKTEAEEISVEKLEEALVKLTREVEGLRPATSTDGQLCVKLDEMVALTGLDAATFDELYFSRLQVEATYLQLYKRAKHVFEEALRVLQFRKICISCGGSLVQFGDLMNASQKSCAEVYERPCPELNQLTALAREAGAIGSRLTGSGMGRVESSIAQVRASYDPYKGLEGDELRKSSLRRSQVVALVVCCQS